MSVCVGGGGEGVKIGHFFVLFPLELTVEQVLDHVFTSEVDGSA